MNSAREHKIAGGLLFLGTLVLLVTIYFEFRIGWIQPVERPADEVPRFIMDNWPGLKAIWSWQMFANFLETVAYVLLVKNARNIGRVPTGVLWTVSFLFSLMTLMAYGLTVGSYGEALKVFDTQPALFLSIRGAIGSLYIVGRFGMLFLLIVFGLETFSDSGIIPRKVGIGALLIVLIAIVLAAIGIVSPKLIGLPAFLLPLTLGYYYWRRAD